MYPHERSLVKKLEDKPFVLIGINSDRDKEELKKAMEEEKITWRSFWNGGSTQGPISTKWNVHGWPTLFVIDHNGVIRGKYLGSPGPAVLDKLIDELVLKAETRG
jgi:Thioredoxin-like